MNSSFLGCKGEKRGRCFIFLYLFVLGVDRVKIWFDPGLVYGLEGMLGLGFGPGGWTGL